MTAASMHKKIALRKKMEKHLMFFHTYQIEAFENFVPKRNYYELMEEIISMYISLEINIIRLVNRRMYRPHDEYSKQITTAASRVCRLMSIVLRNKEKHCVHVLLKVGHPPLTYSVKDLLRTIYQ